MGINTPFAQISAHDKARISRLSDGDILCLHHAFHGLTTESRAYLEGVAQNKALTINRAIGKPNRVGHTLDVGHARNNGSISEQYPISRWYALMGNQTVAYHIHQVVPREEGGLKNHQAIVDWFGPVISYVSFFYAWGEQMVNHVPVFLEVGGCESFDKSIRAFECVFGK